MSTHTEICNTRINNENVGMKPESYVAEAQAILYAPPHCIELLRQGNTEKGDALKTARVAGIWQQNELMS